MPKIFMKLLYINNTRSVC